MNLISRHLNYLCFIFLLISDSNEASELLHDTNSVNFKVITFYSGINDPAHVSFVKEANKWFADAASKNNFSYESTNIWNNLNKEYLSKYSVVLFLDTRPENAEQRAAFEEYMKNGGGWIGFHFSAFALTESAYNQNWDWYHNEFIGSGEYKGNTWRPTSAFLQVEDSTHSVTKSLPYLFKSSPMNGTAGKMI